MRRVRRRRVDALHVAQPAGRPQRPLRVGRALGRAGLRGPLGGGGGGGRGRGTAALGRRFHDEECVDEILEQVAVVLAKMDETVSQLLVLKVAVGKIGIMLTLQECLNLVEICGKIEADNVICWQFPTFHDCQVSTLSQLTGGIQR